MKSISMGNLTSFLMVGCSLLVLVSASGCSCRPKVEVGSPADTSLPTTTPSPTLDGRTSIPEEVAGLALDISLLTDDPCRVPCWHNIIPGVSGVDDVRAQLENSPFVRKGTLRYGATEEAGVPVTRFSWQAKSENYNRVTFRDEKVVRIEIQVDHDWALSDVVGKFGDPEYVVSHQFGEEAPGYLVVLYYPAQGVQFRSSTYPFAGEYRITKDLKVTQGVYFAPTTLEGMLSEAYLCPPGKMETCLGDIRQWEGFED